jgi:hypothetical protein
VKVGAKIVICHAPASRNERTTYAIIAKFFLRHKTRATVVVENAK